MNTVDSSDEDFDDDWESEQSSCPYCSCSDGSCEHLLLVVDVHWQTAEGGVLMDVLNDHWGVRIEDADEEFDKIVEFDRILKEIGSFADVVRTPEYSGPGPGFDSTYREYWVQSQEKVQEMQSRLAVGKP